MTANDKITNSLIFQWIEKYNTPYLIIVLTRNDLL